MCEYIKWIFNPDNINTNIFTVISVVLSGLISWGISAIYFSRGNRNNLRASVLCPIRRLLENNPITNENYRKLAEYTKDYSMKYLKSREHPIVDELLSAYQEVCRYKYEYVCAESLQSYFNYKLKKNGIEPVVTLVHNDMPLYLAKKFNGFADRYVIDCFVKYSKTVFERYKDKITYWITINEINNMVTKDAWMR